MFKTVQQSAIFEDGPRGADGVQLWSHVETEIWPWFYVEVHQGYGEEGYRTMLMLPNVAVLADVLASQAEHVKINQVYLVSPATLNGTVSWEMQNLQKVEISRAPDGTFKDVYCTVNSGVRYSLFDVQPDTCSPSLQTLFSSG